MGSLEQSQTPALPSQVELIARKIKTLTLTMQIITMGTSVADLYYINPWLWAGPGLSALWSVRKLLH